MLLNTIDTSSMHSISSLLDTITHLTPGAQRKARGDDPAAERRQRIVRESERERETHSTHLTHSTRSTRSDTLRHARHSDTRHNRHSDTCHAYKLSIRPPTLSRHGRHASTPLTPVSIDTASTPPRHRLDTSRHFSTRLDTSDTSDTLTLQGSRAAARLPRRAGGEAAAPRAAPGW